MWQYGIKMFNVNIQSRIFLSCFAGSRTYGVAFTVVPSSTTTYSSGSIIQFNRLKYNQGNGFSTGNYRFTAPAAGMYVFSWSLSIHSSYVGNSRLVKNGSTYHQIYCKKTYQQCGATVTMWLNRGDRVWVASDYSSIYVYATYSSFSGWKINWKLYQHWFISIKGNACKLYLVMLFLIVYFWVSNQLIKPLLSKTKTILKQTLVKFLIHVCCHVNINSKIYVYKLLVLE